MYSRRQGRPWVYTIQSGPISAYLKNSNIHTYKYIEGNLKLTYVNVVEPQDKKWN